MTIDADVLGAGKHVADGLSVGVLLATLLNALPHIATLLTVIWAAIRLYETPTVQRRVRARRLRARARRRART